MRYGTVDTSKMTLVVSRKPMIGRKNGEWSEVYLDRVVENDKKITSHYVRANFMRHWNEKLSRTEDKPTLSYYRYTESKQKFLCLGGPFTSQFLAEPGPDYSAFNKADCTRGDRQKHHKVVYIHRTQLREDLL